MDHPTARAVAVASCLATTHCAAAEMDRNSSTNASASLGSVESSGDDGPASNDSGQETGAATHSGPNGDTGVDPDDDGSGESSLDSTGEDTASDETSGEGEVDPDSILFRADFDDAMFPVYGFSYEMITEGYSSREAVVGEGPQGADFCAYHMVENDQGSQPYIGWAKQELPMTPMGEARYIRLLVRIQSPCDGLGLDDVWGDKFIILGDGVPDPWGPVGRVIVMMGDPLDGTLQTSIMRNIDGAEHGTEAVALECGTWHWLQWEVRSSSDQESNDGGFKFWVDDDNASYDSATRVSPGFPLVSAIDEVPGNVWNNLDLGYYVGTSLASGTIGFDFAAFEYGTQFDPSWHE